MNEYFAQTLAQVLEETSTNMGNAMILDHLAKKGIVSIEEAEFYHNLCADVITEAAEDFIPDTLDVPEAPEAMAPMELYDAVGNKYVFQDGDLIPVDGDEDGMNPEDEGIPAEAPAEVPAPEAAPVVPAPVVPAPEEEQYTEGSEIATTVLNDTATTPIAGVTTAEDTSGEGTVGTVLEGEDIAPEVDEVAIEESTVIADEAPALLEESDNVVARILANLR
jgi:hypothetical protein